MVVNKRVEHLRTCEKVLTLQKASLTLIRFLILSSIFIKGYVKNVSRFICFISSETLKLKVGGKS